MSSRAHVPQWHEVTDSDNRVGEMDIGGTLEKFASLNSKPDNGKFIINIYSAFEVTNQNERKCFAYLLKLIAQGIQLSQKNEDSLILNVHLSDFKLRTVRKEFLVNTIQFVQLLYPNCLHRCYLINSPLIFRTVYDLISKVINPRLRRKIEFV